MFGYVKPVKGELLVKEYEFYRAVYCGLCRALKGKVGCLAQMTLNYDFVFLALVAMNYNGEKTEIEQRRCILHPIRKIPAVKCNPTIESVARVNALLAYYKIKDDIQDRKILKKLTGAMLLPFVYIIKRRAGVCKETAEAVKLSMEEISKLERGNCSSPDIVADSFGNLLQILFEYTVIGEREKKLAAACGHICGKWIYLIDALDDFCADRKNGDYNPLVLSGLPEKDAMESILILTVKDFEGVMLLTDFTDKGTENIIKNIVYLGFVKQSEDIAEKTYKKINDLSNKGQKDKI